MKKILAIAAMALLMGVQANAQISQGEPVARKIQVGNRPVEGSFGMYIGATTGMFNDLFDADTEVKSLPLLNLKYMFTDQLEGRIGLQFYKKAENAAVTNDYGGTNDKRTFEYLTTENRIYPGLAYHFSPRNILDAYIGAELLLGWNREKSQVLDKDKYNIGGAGSLCSIQAGCGVFFGLQAFIGDLPLALGLEYGIHGYGNFNQKYKCRTEDGDIYTIDPTHFDYISGNVSGKKLSASTSEFGQQLRITLSYYFY